MGEEMNEPDWPEDRWPDPDRWPAPIDLDRLPGDLAEDFLRLIGLVADELSRATKKGADQRALELVQVLHRLYLVARSSDPIEPIRHRVDNLLEEFEA